MPSPTHESIVDLFRNCPPLAIELLRSAGIEPPAHTIPRITSAEFTDLDAAEYRADVVIRLDKSSRQSRDRASEAVIVEIQLDRDSDKRYSWPVYVAGVHSLR